MRQEPEQTWSLFRQPPEPPPQVRDTSIAAYVEHGESGQLRGQQLAIVSFLREHQRNYTRGELSAAMGMRLSAVCARTFELIAKKVLQDEKKRKCSLTGREAHVIELVP